MSNINSTNTTHSKFTNRYSLCHSLAKDAVNQIGKLELKAQDIVKAMGYSQKHTTFACDRLRHVLSSEILGLNNNEVDTYFTAHEFLRALLIVLNIQYEPFAGDIAQIEYNLAHYAYPLPRYSLGADVDFTWSEGANWMSRGIASSKAKVYLPKDIAKMSDAERELVIQNCMREHYKRHNGNLPYNGIIKGYLLTIRQGDAVVDKATFNLPNMAVIN